MATDLLSTIENNSEREFLVRVSLIEVYNEKVRDLLDLTKTDLKIRENYNGLVTVENCKYEITESEEKFMEVVKTANKARHIGDTKSNNQSSRSHALCHILIESTVTDPSTDPSAEGTTGISQLNIVDLAGSERASVTGATSNQLVEGGFINKTPLTLTNVITQLSKENAFVNFRDSKLTRILSNALSGNSKISKVASITPVSIEDSISTLKFARSAKLIKTKPVINTIQSSESVLRQYQDQARKLQSQLEAQKVIQTSQFEEIESLQKQLSQIKKFFVPIKKSNKGAKKISNRRHTTHFASIDTMDPTPIDHSSETGRLSYDNTTTTLAHKNAVLEDHVKHQQIQPNCQEIPSFAEPLVEQTEEFSSVLLANQLEDTKRQLARLQEDAEKNERMLLESLSRERSEKTKWQQKYEVVAERNDSDLCSRLNFFTEENERLKAELKSKSVNTSEIQRKLDDALNKIEHISREGQMLQELFKTESQSNSVEENNENFGSLIEQLTKEKDIVENELLMVKSSDNDKEQQISRLQMQIQDIADENLELVSQLKRNSKVLETLAVKEETLQLNLDQANKRITTNEKATENIKKESECIKIENESIKKENEVIKKENESIKKENENLSNELLNLRIENEELKVQIRELQEQTIIVGDPNDSIATQERELQRMTEIAEIRNERINDLKETLQVKERQLQNAEKALENFKNQSYESSILQEHNPNIPPSSKENKSSSRLQSLNDEISKLNAELQQKHEQLMAVKLKEQSYQDQVEEVNEKWKQRLESMQKNTERLENDLKSAILSSESNVKQLAANVEILKKYEKLDTHYKESILALQTEKSQLEMERENYTGDLEKLRKIIANIERQNKHLELKLDEKVNEIETLKRDALKNTIVSNKVADERKEDSDRIETLTKKIETLQSDLKRAEHFNANATKGTKIHEDTIKNLEMKIKNYEGKIYRMNRNEKEEREVNEVNKIHPSQQRKETLEMLSAIQNHLLKMLNPSNSSSSTENSYIGMGLHEAAPEKLHLLLEKILKEVADSTDLCEMCLPIKPICAELSQTYHSVQWHMQNGSQLFTDEFSELIRLVNDYLTSLLDEADSDSRNKIQSSIDHCNKCLKTFEESKQCRVKEAKQLETMLCNTRQQLNFHISSSRYCDYCQSLQTCRELICTLHDRVYNGITTLHQKNYKTYISKVFGSNTVGHYEAKITELLETLQYTRRSQSVLNELQLLQEKYSKMKWLAGSRLKNIKDLEEKLVHISGTPQESCDNL